MSRGRKGFHPRQVPEIRNGYFWLVKDQVGFGTTSFRIPEGNKHPDFDMIQATVASQYTLLTENGGLQARMRKAADGNPSFLATAGAVQAGWTGPTYIAGWWRLPDVSGDVTGIGSLFSHSLTTGNQRRLNMGMATNTPDRFTSTSSDDGLLHATYNPNSNSTFDGSYKWLEFIFDPRLSLGGSSPDNVWKHFSQLVQLSFVVVPTSAPASLLDAAARIVLSCRGDTFAAGVDTLDWVSCYYGNGIPTLKNRKRLANYLNPSNVKFQI